MRSSVENPNEIPQLRGKLRRVRAVVCCWVASVGLLGCGGTAAPAAEPSPAPAPQSTVAVAPPSPEADPSPDARTDADADGGADAGPSVRELAERLDRMELRPIGARSPGPSLALGRDVSDFLRAANGNDDAAARARCTDACWQKECRSFAAQAGAKFRAEAASYREQGERAVVRVTIVCPGERVCDEADLMLIRVAPSVHAGWRVAGITENEAKANAWLEGR